MDLQERKDAMRRLVLSRRSRLGDEERGARAAALIDQLLGLPEMSEATSVLAFASFASEVPTETLLDAILAGERELLLPYVAEDGTMRATPVRSRTELEPGYRGIPEPRARFPVDAARADAIVVPGVAFDAAGRRLGYGGGFYDMFLRAAPEVVRIGICFEVQIVDEVPTGPHDEPVQVVVTEERVLRP